MKDAIIRSQVLYNSSSCRFVFHVNFYVCLFVSFFFPFFLISFGFFVISYFRVGRANIFSLGAYKAQSFYRT